MKKRKFSIRRAKRANSLIKRRSLLQKGNSLIKKIIDGSEDTSVNLSEIKYFQASKRLSVYMHRSNSRKSIPSRDGSKGKETPQPRGGTG